MDFKSAASVASLVAALPLTTGNAAEFPVSATYGYGGACRLAASDSDIYAGPEAAAEDEYLIVSRSEMVGYEWACEPIVLGKVTPPHNVGMLCSAPGEDPEYETARFEEDVVQGKLSISFGQPEDAIELERCTELSPRSKEQDEPIHIPNSSSQRFEFSPER